MKLTKTYNETGKESSKVASSADRVGRDIGPKLSSDERKGDEPNAESGGMRRAIIEEATEEINR